MFVGSFEIVEGRHDMITIYTEHLKCEANKYLGPRKPLVLHTTDQARWFQMFLSTELSGSRSFIFPRRFSASDVTFVPATQAASLCIRTAYDNSVCPSGTVR